MKLSKNSMPKKWRLVLTKGEYYYRLCTYCGNWIFRSYDTDKEMKGTIDEWWYPEELVEQALNKD